MKNTELKRCSLDQLEPSSGSIVLKKLLTLPFPREKYTELNQFRKEIIAQDERLLHLYCSKQQVLLKYRLVFFFLGSLFFFLSFLLYRGNPTFLSHQFLDASGFVQKSLISLSFAFGLITFAYGYFMNSERETIIHLFHKAKQRLNRIYRKKIISIGDWKERLFSKHSLALKSAKHDLLEAMETQRHEVLHLIERIRKSEQSREKKSLLYHQALLEWNEKLNQLISSFERNIS